MKKQEFIKFVGDYSFSCDSLEGIYGEPNVQSMPFGSTGLAIVKELDAAFQREVFYLRVIGDPGPLWVEDSDALQIFRREWCGKSIPLYSPSIAHHHYRLQEDFCASFTDAVEFMIEFLTGVEDVYKAARDQARGIFIAYKATSLELQTVMDNYPDYNIIYDLLSPAKARKHLEVMETVKSIGSVIHRTGLCIDELTGLNEGITVLSARLLRDSDSGCIKYHNDDFVRNWSNKYVILRNKHNPVNISSETAIREFLINFLECGGECVTNGILHDRYEDVLERLRSLICKNSI